MIMTKSETNKLDKPIATDFKIIARKTGLMELDYCEKILYDIKVMIENDFLEKVSLILDKPKYTPFKVKQFIIGSTERKINDRPGNNDWEENEGERLHVVLSYTKLWLNKTVEERDSFQKQNLKIGWVSTSIDTNFPHLSKTITKRYSTGINGIDRTDFN